jgi:transcriptional antiterminator RfaH
LAALKFWTEAGNECWYLVRTKPRKEGLAQCKLDEFVGRTFLPKIKTWNSRNSACTESLEPLFPGYLFALLDLESTLYRVLHTVGVAGVVCAGSTPSEVDPAIIEEISRRGRNGVIELPRRTFQEGEPVRVTDGPMEGFGGIFEHYRSGLKRVALLLNVVGGTVKVIVPATSVVTAAAG